MSEAFTALVRAQSEMTNAELNRSNPNFDSRYADLTAVRAATVPALSRFGLAIIQETHYDEAGFRLVARLVHSSGEVIARSVYPLSVNASPQQTGSEITYARRYTWAALCAITAEEDDDANAAQTIPPPSPQPSNASGQQKDPAQELWQSIAACKSLQDLQRIWRENLSRLKEMKEAEPRTYHSLSSLKEQRKRELSPAHPRQAAE